VYRQVRGLGALGANECPAGYTFDGSACQPNAYDCLTPEGKRGKSDGQGGCTYIAQPSPLVYYPPQTSCPPGQVPTKGSPTGCAHDAWGQPCNDPWGNVGVINISGGCEAIPALPKQPTYTAPPVVQPPPPTPVVQPTAQERNESCKKKYGPSWFSLFHGGEWVCGECNPDEMADLASGTCWCGPDRERAVPGDNSSPCVPRGSVQPTPPPSPPTSQAGMGKMFFVGAVALAIFGIGAGIVGSKKERES